MRLFGEKSITLQLRIPQIALCIAPWPPRWEADDWPWKPIDFQCLKS